MLPTFRYLNTQYIKKQKFSDADINYGGFGVELNEQMLEIGEVNPLIYKKKIRGGQQLQQPCVDILRNNNVGRALLTFFSLYVTLWTLILHIHE